MSLLLSGLWPGLAAALLLGLLVGALTGRPRDRLGLALAAVPAVVLAVLSGLAITEFLPGETGLWVETAALMLAAYLAGCALGGVGRLFAKA